jgi:hypothetical protein
MTFTDHARAGNLPLLFPYVWEARAMLANPKTDPRLIVPAREVVDTFNAFINGILRNSPDLIPEWAFLPRQHEIRAARRARRKADR